MITVLKYMAFDTAFSYCGKNQDTPTGRYNGWLGDTEVSADRAPIQPRDDSSVNNLLDTPVHDR